MPPKKTAKVKRKVAARTRAGASPRASAAPKFDENFRKLIQDAARPQVNEAKVQSNLEALFRAMGKEHLNPQHNIKGGRADIHISDCNVIIECKKSGTANPDSPGSPRKGQEKKTQREQLFDYVNGIRDEKRGWRKELAETTKRPWVGVLTDGKKWWAWKWAPDSGDPQNTYMDFVVASGKEIDVFENISKLLFNEESLGKPWVPDRPLASFMGKEESLTKIYGKVAKNKNVKLKFELWEKILKVSGLKLEQDDLLTTRFVRHCYLVILSKAVISVLTPGPMPDPENLIKGELGGDFTSWVIDTHEGKEWVQRILDITYGFDWRATPMDVFRNFYENVIPKKDRRAYGEYYTPDWLVEMLCEEVLDKEWIESATRAALRVIDKRATNLDGIGVLDPACGSGTFLYHAASRILSESDALKGREPQEQADCVALLVHGIDVHPVSVELARATLLRALPTIPSKDRELNIHQGDSLIAGGGGEERLLVDVNFPSDKERLFSLPRSAILQPGFNATARKMVASAVRGDEITPAILEGVIAEDRGALKLAHDKIRTLCVEKGDSIWYWLIFNMVAPHRLAQVKVNRILANPPWVVNNSIRVKERQRIHAQMAKDRDIWVGSTVATSFDIAALFVVRCSELYLKLPNQARTAWVVPWAATRGENWVKFREKYIKKTGQEIFDLSELGGLAFSSSKSCVLVQSENTKGKKTTRWVLSKRAKQNFERDDPWSFVDEQTKWSKAPPPPPSEKSEYLSASKSLSFRQGASILPYCLLAIDNSKERRGGRVDIKTQFKDKPDEKKKTVWDQVGAQEGNIPKRWVADVIFPNDLLPFCLRQEVSKAIIPLSASGYLEEKPNTEAYWEKVEEIYAENKGKGDGTPQTLMARLDFNKGLSLQLPLKKSVTRIVYNTSGQYLRASRCPAKNAIGTSFFWCYQGREEEGLYLLAMLNADCLRYAYAAARRSDRDFHTHIWREVPIPKYSSTNIRHKKLAKLARQAERVAQKICDLNDTGQIKASEEIRNGLREDGVMGKIDAIISEMLPRHATPFKK